MSRVLQLLNSGPLCTVQDMGRFGKNHLGLTSGGCYDPFTMQIANKLVGNPLDSAVLEITLGHFEARVLAPCTIALCGPEIAFYVNEKQRALWHSIYLKPGDIIRLGQAQFGIRNILALSGGIKTPLFFGSQSTVIREQIGNKLSSFDFVFQHQPSYSAEKSLAQHLIPQTSAAPINMILGAQCDAFSQTDITRFLTSSYLVTNQCDRMGYRLSGAKVDSPKGARYSEGIALGAIQIPADGQPIVLLNDRQTIGGYPKLGAVTQLDCARLLQKRPGDDVFFEAISLERAHNLAHLAKVKHQKVLDSI